MSDATVRGRFIWHELVTTDTAAAAAFYQKAIGWKSQAWPQNPSYTMFVAKASPMAGLMALTEDAKKRGSPPCWVIYVGTPNVDETARRAVEMGGTILKEPTDISGVGRFAVIQDPQGAVFSAFTPLQDPRGGDAMTLGDFSWHDLITTDRPAAFSFYERLFGWVKTEVMEMGPRLGVHQLFGWPGKTLGGISSNRHVPGPPHWLAYAMVSDSKKVVELVTKLGGRVLHGPIELPGGDWIAQCSDPQGAVFAVRSMKPAVPEPTVKLAPAKKAAMKPSAPKSGAKKPTVKEPAVKKPVAQEPAVKKPVAQKPAVKKTVAKKPARGKPAAKKPVAKKPPAKKPAVKKTVAKKPARGKPAAKKPVAKKLLVKKAALKKATKKATKKAMPTRKPVPSKAAAKARAKGKKG